MRNLIAVIGLITIIACEPIGKATSKLSVGSDTIPLGKDYIAVVPTVSNESGNWAVDSTFDPMDEVAEATLSLKADKSLTLPFPYNDAVPTMVIRCGKKQTNLYIDMKIPAKTNYGTFSEIPVRYRIDGGKPISSTWSQSTDLVAAFAPEPIALAKRLSVSRSLLFEFTPYQTAPVDVQFTLTGLAHVLPQVASACHWDYIEKKQAIIDAQIAQKAERDRADEKRKAIWAKEHKFVRDRATTTMQYWLTECGWEVRDPEYMATDSEAEAKGYTRVPCTKNSY